MRRFNRAVKMTARMAPATVVARRAGRCSLLGLLDLAVDVVERGLSPVAFTYCVPCFLLGVLVGALGRPGGTTSRDADGLMTKDQEAAGSTQ